MHSKQNAKLTNGTNPKQNIQYNEANFHQILVTD